MTQNLDLRKGVTLTIKKGNCTRERLATPSFVQLRYERSTCFTHPRRENIQNKTKKNKKGDFIIHDQALAEITAPSAERASSPGLTSTLHWAQDFQFLRYTQTPHFEMRESLT